MQTANINILYYLSEYIAKIKFVLFIQGFTFNSIITSLPFQKKDLTYEHIPLTLSVDYDDKGNLNVKK